MVPVQCELRCVTGAYLKPARPALRTSANQIYTDWTCQDLTEITLLAFELASTGAQVCSQQFRWTIQPRQFMQRCGSQHLCEAVSTPSMDISELEELITQAEWQQVRTKRTSHRVLVFSLTARAQLQGSFASSEQGSKVGGCDFGPPDASCRRRCWQLAWRRPYFWRLGS